jgi:glycosyltransferase involved in cell wall biosynthesis
MARALQEAEDDGAVRRRGEQARRRWVERFSPETTTAALIDIYQTAAGSRRGGG